MKKVRLRRDLVTEKDGFRLNKEGDTALGKINQNVVVVGGKEQPISPNLAVFYNLQKVLLISNIGVPFDETQKTPFAEFCRKFLDLGILEEFVPEEKPVVHGDAADSRTLEELLKKKKLDPDTVREALSIPQVTVDEKSLEEIDAILLKLSTDLGALRAAIVEVGDVPKNAGLKEILKNCKLTSFLVEGKRAEDIRLVEARALVVQCFNFQRAAVSMNLGAVEGFGFDKKSRLKKVLTLADADGKHIVFLVDMKKPGFVFLLEAYGTLPGLMLLELEKAVLEVLSKL